MSDPNDLLAPRVVPVPNANARPVTEDELNKAFDQKRDTIGRAALTFTGPAALTVATGLENTLLGRSALSLAGFHSAPPGSRIAVRPGPLIVTYVLPAPFGYVPPEEYRITPDYAVGSVTDNVIGRTLGVHSTPEREAVYQARERARGLLVDAENRLGLPPTNVPTDRLRADVAFLEATKDLIPQSAAALPHYATELTTRDLLPLDTGGLRRVPSATEAPLIPTPSASSVFGPSVELSPLIPTQAVPSVTGQEREPSYIEQLLGVRQSATADPPPTNISQQDAAKRAPELLRNLLTERTDP